MLTPDLAAVLHTYDGVQIAQYPAGEQVQMTWTRELRNVSRCDLNAPQWDGDMLPDIVPWQHWLSVWDTNADELCWTGPVQKVTADREGILLNALDIGTYLTRTRMPIEKQWDATDPTIIAGELWTAMMAHHGLRSRPVVRYNPLINHYDYTAKGDEQMMDTAIGDLVGLGLLWSVVGGTPILGPAPLEPVAALSENDFAGAKLQITRDGSRTFNDVVVRGADELARAVVPLGGIKLQTNIELHDMFGVSNAANAARLYAAYTSQVRDVISVPGGAVLHPAAAVTWDMLVPTARFVVEAYGVMNLMQLTSVTATSSSGTLTVGVTMEAVDDRLPELVKLQTTAAGGGSR